jgi:hypothetical protein
MFRRISCLAMAGDMLAPTTIGMQRSRYLSCWASDSRWLEIVLGSAILIANCLGEFLEGDKVVPKLQRRGRPRYKRLEDPIFLRSPVLSHVPSRATSPLEAPGSNLIVDLADSEMTESRKHRSKRRQKLEAREGDRSGDSGFSATIAAGGFPKREIIIPPMAQKCFSKQALTRDSGRLCGYLWVLWRTTPAKSTQ